MSDKTVYCARCGVSKRPGRKGRVLCADCRYVLSYEEIELWQPREQEGEQAA